jgi:outer membrane murein-binding lipoprotein Lpp
MALPCPTPAHRHRATLLLTGLGCCGVLLLSGCDPRKSQPSAAVQDLQQRQEQLDLKLQQLEQRLNAIPARNAADSAGKPPAGPVKSLTLRKGTEDDRLRIYWADGSSSDLPCTQEQNTLVCG